MWTSPIPVSTRIFRSPLSTRNPPMVMTTAAVAVEVPAVRVPQSALETGEAEGRRGGGHTIRQVR